MAVQKRRQSKGRKNSRRSQWMKTSAPALATCPSCGESRLSHRACPSCGKYGAADSARVVIVKDDKESQEAAS